jgi:hypothetical protein
MHDPNWIPEGYPGGGKIIVFNNIHSYQQSAVLVFDPPQDGPGLYSDPGGDAYGPETYDWIYDEQGLYSSNISGAHRLPNGNTLICEGAGGNFTEVTLEDKELVWYYRSPVNLFGPITQGSPAHDILQFKIERYGPDYQGLDGKDLTPGEPVELDPWNYDCTIYWDSTTTFINNDLMISDITVVNPFQDQLSFYFNDYHHAHFQVVNMQGVVMKEGEMHAEKASINTCSWPGGMYILKILTSGLSLKTTKVLKVD